MSTMRLAPSTYAVSNTSYVTAANVSNRTDTAYLKVNGAWVAVSKVYKKVSGAWVQQSNLQDVFDTSTKYVKG